MWEKLRIAHQSPFPGKLSFLQISIRGEKTIFLHIFDIYSSMAHFCPVKSICWPPIMQRKPRTFNLFHVFYECKQKCKCPKRASQGCIQIYHRWKVKASMLAPAFPEQAHFCIVSCADASDTWIPNSWGNFHTWWFS